MLLQADDEKLLNALCDKYGSDKGSELGHSDVYAHKPHNYTKIYASLFYKIKNENLIIFECGIGTNNPNLSSSMGINGKPGASLRVWRDYFVNSTIYGADIDKDILFNEDRITTSFMDQTDSQSIQEFWELNNVYPNIIIDDGLHEFHAGISLFENSFHRLTKNGIYIIEDILPDDLVEYRKYFNKTKLNILFISIARPETDREPGRDDNNLMIVLKD